MRVIIDVARAGAPLGICLPLTNYEQLDIVERVWPRENYQRGDLRPYENIVHFCMELRVDSYVEAWFSEGGDHVNMYERFCPINTLVWRERNGGFSMNVWTTRRAVYRWSKLNETAAQNWWRSQPQNMHQLTHDICDLN